MSIAAGAAAATYAELLVRIAELTKVLISKGVLSQMDLRNSLSEEEREDLATAAMKQFVERFEQIGSLEDRTGGDNEPDRERSEEFRR